MEKARVSNLTRIHHDGRTETVSSSEHKKNETFTSAASAGLVRCVRQHGGRRGAFAAACALARTAFIYVLYIPHRPMGQVRMKSVMGKGEKNWTLIANASSSFRYVNRGGKKPNLRRLHLNMFLPS